MKLQPPLHRRSAGSVLIVSLITCAILGALLASYLILVQTQSASIMRAQAWNSSLALAEAGVEEALSQLNRNAPFFDPAEATMNLTANSWTCASGVYEAPRRYLGMSFYDVEVRMNGVTPAITAAGYRWMSDSIASAPTTAFATINLNVPPPPNYQRRGVLVNTRFDPLFAVAMAALRTIDFKGNNVATDSFDSADPLFSTNGLYPLGISSMVKSNGDVCTDFSIINSISVGNANIHGKAKTGPNGTVAVGSGGYVTGGVYDDFNVDFPSVSLPQVSWLVAETGNFTYDGVNYKHRILQNGNYALPGLSGGIYIATNVSANLLLTADTKLTGNNDQIYIALGGRLIMYVNSPTFSLAGNGVVNYPGNATNFFYYGTTNNTTVKFNANGSFTGAVYAPQADYTLGGGGNDVYDFVGASVTKTVVMNGHYRFHYDENLRRIGPSKGFVPTRWTEI